MRWLFPALGLTFLAGSSGRSPERDELLAADRALARAAEIAGVTDAFVPALTDNAAYLHPGAPLIRGKEKIRSFLESAAPLAGLTWEPAYGDVSADGLFGYTYGWTRFGANQGKYLACWKKSTSGSWHVTAYARTTPVPVSDSLAWPAARNGNPAAPVRGRADQHELIRADSAFSAMSAAQGAKAAFVAFSADDAISFGAGTQFNEGREAIGAAFNTFPKDAVLEWQPVYAEIARSGDLGCTVGEAAVSTLHYYSKYLTIWKRQPDGNWKFVADGGNVRPAPPSDIRPPED
jgi:ketosteroid isomerase-like protein